MTCQLTTNILCAFQPCAREQRTQVRCACSSELRIGYIGHFTAKIFIPCGLILVVSKFLDLYLSCTAMWALLENLFFKSMTSLGHVTAKFGSF